MHQQIGGIAVDIDATLCAKLLLGEPSAEYTDDRDARILRCHGIIRRITDRNDLAFISCDGFLDRCKKDIRCRFGCIRIIRTDGLVNKILNARDMLQCF